MCSNPTTTKNSKMNKLRSIIIMACLLAPAALTRAEVAKWIIRPVNQAISRMSSSHFKAWNAEKCGVFNSEGKQVVPFMADSITDFVDGHAVVLRLEDDRWRLLSVLHVDGSISTRTPLWAANACWLPTKNVATCSLIWKGRNSRTR